MGLTAGTIPVSCEYERRKGPPKLEEEMLQVEILAARLGAIRDALLCSPQLWSGLLDLDQSIADWWARFPSSVLAIRTQRDDDAA
jgi:hypothetical protein